MSKNDKRDKRGFAGKNKSNISIHRFCNDHLYRREISLVKKKKIYHW